MLITLYDGYYIYSPVEKEYTDESGNIKTKYEHELKPYIHYAVRYKIDASNNIVVNYSLDNYITVYGYINGQYISRAGYLIAEEDMGVQLYDTNKITDDEAKSYYKAGKEFTKWIKTENYEGLYTIADIVKPKNAVVPETEKTAYSESYEILNVTKNNDPEDVNSDFCGYKREIMKQSIQSNLNNAIYVYDQHTTLSKNFRMPKLSEEDWDKVLSNINIMAFMQGLPVGIKEYNNYAIVTSTKNKQFVDKELLYYTANGEYHQIDCPDLLTVAKNNPNAIKGYRSIAYQVPNKQENQDPVYERSETGCYKCIVNPSNERKEGNQIEEYIDIEAHSNLQQVYYTTLARERWKLNKPGVTLE